MPSPTFHTEAPKKLQCCRASSRAHIKPENSSGTGMRQENGVCLSVLVQGNLAKMGHSDRTLSQRAERLGAMSGDSGGIETP